MFVREARRLRLWRAAEMDSRCREFLRLLTIDAYSEKGYDHQGHRFPDMISHVDGSILPEVQQAFSRSAAWRYFEQARLALSVSPPPRRVEAQPAREPEQPREGPTHGSPAAASEPAREVIQVNNAAMIMFSPPARRRKKRKRKRARPRVQKPATHAEASPATTAQSKSTDAAPSAALPQMSAPDSALTPDPKPAELAPTPLQVLPFKTPFELAVYAILLKQPTAETSDVCNRLDDYKVEHEYEITDDERSWASAYRRSKKQRHSIDLRVSNVRTEMRKAGLLPPSQVSQ